MPLTVTDAICQICGKHFQIHVFKSRAGRGKYCSLQCRYKSQRGKHFGKPFKKGMVSPRRKKPPNKDVLEHLYWQERRPLIWIAKYFGVSISTTHRWLKEYGIKRRGPSEAHKGQIAWNRGKQWSVNKEVLVDLRRKQWSAKKIGEFFAVSETTILSRMEEYGISTEKIIRRKHLFSKADLDDLYHKQHLSIYKIEEKVGVPRSSIAYWLKKYGINRRSRLRAALKGLALRPTKPEKALIKIVKEKQLPLRYVGTGDLIIGGKNPDFVASNGERKVVEVFGRAFHDPEVSFVDVSESRTYEGTLRHYKKCGYDVLIIWDDELEDNTLVERIKDFLEGKNLGQSSFFQT